MAEHVSKKMISVALGRRIALGAAVTTTPIRRLSPAGVLATAVLAVAAGLGGLVSAAPAQAAANPCAGASAEFIGTNADWTTQSDWVTPGTTTPLSHIPGSNVGETSYPTPSVCWQGGHAPIVENDNYNGGGSDNFTVLSVNAQGIAGGDSLAVDGGSLQIDGSSTFAAEIYVENSLALLTLAGSSSTITTPNVDVSAGELDLSGGTSIDTTGKVEIDLGGTLKATGSSSVNGLLDNLGRVAINAGALLNATQGYFQNAPATLAVTIAAAGNTGQLSVNGETDLDGFLDLTHSGYTPVATDNIPVVTTNTSIGGFFTNTLGRDLGSGQPGDEAFVPQYSTDQVTLKVEPGFTPVQGTLTSGEPSGDADSTVTTRSLSGVSTVLTTGHDPEISQDGRYLLLKSGTTTDRTNATLEVYDIGAGASANTLTLPTGTPSITGVTISPDDGYVVFDDSCAIYDEALIGGAPTILSNSEEGCLSNPQFTPDGTSLVVQGSTGIDTFSVGGSASKILNTQAGDVDPSVSPDGNTVAFDRPDTGNSAAFEVWTTPLSAGEEDGVRPRVTTAATELSTKALLGGEESPVRWSADGTGVYVDGTYDGDSSGYGRDGIYRLETEANEGPELLSGTLVTPPSTTGNDEAFAMTDTDGAATTLPPSLTPGDPTLNFYVVGDAATGQQVAPSDVQFFFSGITGLTASDIDLTTQGGQPLTVTDHGDGRFTATDDNAFDDIGANQADFSGYAIGLAPTTPGGTLLVTSHVQLDGTDVATADAPIFVNNPAETAPIIGNATPGDTTATITFTPGYEPSTVTVSSYTVTLTPVTGGAPVTTMVPASGPFAATLTGLTNGTTYNATVQATLGDGEGPASAVVPVTPSGKPFAPATVTPTVTGQGQVSVAVGTAYANGSPVTNYHLTLAGPGSPSRDIAGPGTVVFTGLPDSTTYVANAFATNANGNGPTTTGAAVTTPPTPAPGAPGHVAATPGDAQATITFTPPVGGPPASSYLVTLTPVTGGRSVSVVTPGSPVTIPGLINGTKYAVTVLGQSAFGNSPVSGMGVTVTPHARPTPPKITGIGPAPETLLVGFTQANGDGLPILGDTVTCVGTNHQTAVVHGGSSPIKVTYLHNQINYTCSVVATTAAGTSLLSNKVVAHPGKLPTVTLALPTVASKGSRITIVATLMAAGDVVRFRLATLSVQYGERNKFHAIATGYTNKFGKVTYHVILRKQSTYQVRALFGPAVAFNHGLTVRAI